MPPAANMHDYLGFTRGRWAQLLAGWGEKPYRAGQIMKWLHHRLLDDFGQMTDVSERLRARLAEAGSLAEPEVAEERIAADGVRKWLMRAASGSLFETVFIPEASRGTLCVSSQVGCALDCAFCATGKQGFNSNLKAGEIIGQLRVASRRLQGLYPERARPVTNVVLMGMGEPLLNTSAVIPATELMMDDWGYGVSRRRVTVSTAGVIPGIEALGAARPPASLALSLHAPDNALRSELVPLNRKYPIHALLPACQRYARRLGAKGRVTIEYTLLDGVNDSLDHAKRLARLLKPLPCKINLIPFNPFPGAAYQRPAASAIRRFQDSLIADGYAVTTRITRGEDINAACGQLAGRVADCSRRQAQHQRSLIARRAAEAAA